MKPLLKIRKIYSDVVIGDYVHLGDAGIDVCAYEDATILPGKQHHFHLGFQCEIPEGYIMLLLDKSSIAMKGLQVMGGVIDLGYRGEIILMLRNLTDEPVTFEKGKKVGQMVIIPAVQCDVQFVDDISETSRGEGGFGSTGDKL